MAARIATGMGLHSADQYKNLAIDVVEYQKRLFFSLYMMDRYVPENFIITADQNVC
jgi:Fungal specific transcription factor domain